MGRATLPAFNRRSSIQGVRHDLRLPLPVPVPGSPASRVPRPARHQRHRRRRRRRLLLEAVQDRARQAPPRVRQLRHQRAAAQAGAHRVRGRVGHAQPPRRRGVLHRRGRGDDTPPGRARAWRPPSRTASSAATRCRTRSGSAIPTARRGRCTRCSPTRDASHTSTLRANGTCGAGACATRSQRRRRRVLLRRRALAEFIGTALLLIAVVGSGIAAQRLSPSDTRPAAARERARHGRGAGGDHPRGRGRVGRAPQPAGERARRRASAGWAGARCPRTSSPRWPARSPGHCVANLMFSLPALQISAKQRSGSGLCGSPRAVATFGLLLVVFGLARSVSQPPGAVRGGRVHRGRVLLHRRRPASPTRR